MEVSIHYEYTEKYYGMKPLLVKLFMLTNVIAQVTNYCDRSISLCPLFSSIIALIKCICNLCNLLSSFHDV